MSAPRYWKDKYLLFALEGTYGVDAGPTGAANAILAQEVTYKPMEGQDQERDLEQPGMSANGTRHAPQSTTPRRAQFMLV